MTAPWPGLVPLTLDAQVPLIDLDASIGVRTATFGFRLSDAVSGENIGEITPYVEGANLSHSTESTIKRRLTLSLGVDDTADINPLTDRVSPFMLLGGVEYPLGRYMFTDNLQRVSTGGNQANVSLVDEMFIIDQPLERSFSNQHGESAETVVIRLLQDVPIDIKLKVATSGFDASVTSAIGTRRGQILETLATQGDYQSPWMGNDTYFHMIRTVDAAVDVPAFDYDTRQQIFMDSVTRTTDILNAPNRFIVVANGAGAAEVPLVGSYDVPSSAPYSITGRGFVIPQVTGLQVTTTSQAVAAARAIGISSQVVETVTFTTPPDPRHDSYDVCIFDGSRWLETAWTMALMEGGSMSHTLVRRYR